MKYVKQFALILLFSFLGEVCRFLIPINIPASIYGMVLLFAALSLTVAAATVTTTMKGDVWWFPLGSSLWYA